MGDDAVPESLIDVIWLRQNDGPGPWAFCFRQWFCYGAQIRDVHKTLWDHDPSDQWHLCHVCSFVSGKCVAYFLSTFSFYQLPWWLRWVKRLPAMWETRVRSLGREDPLEKEMAIHSSTLAWKIQWMEEPDRLHGVHGVTKSQTRLTDFTFTSLFHSINTSPIWFTVSWVLQDSKVSRNATKVETFTPPHCQKDFWLLLHTQAFDVKNKRTARLFH